MTGETVPSVALLAKSRELVAQIFAVTGQKVSEDDPVVIAALFQSSLVQKAGERCVHEIREEVGASVLDLQALIESDIASREKQNAHLARFFLTPVQLLAGGVLVFVLGLLMGVALK